MRQVAECKSGEEAEEYISNVLPLNLRAGAEIYSEVYRDDAGVSIDKLLGAKDSIVVMGSV